MFGLYLFEGMMPDGNFDNLHIASHEFDEPRYDALAVQHDFIVTLHGCVDDPGWDICLGGLNQEMKSKVLDAFNRHGLAASDQDHPFEGSTTGNVCNRGRKGPGVQIEVPRSMRDDQRMREKIAHAILDGIRY